MNRKSIIMLAAIAVLLSASAFAQRTDRVTLLSVDGGPPADAVLKPVIKVGDLRSAIQLLQDVDIRPVEVDVFLDVRKVLSDAAKAAASAGRANDATTTVEIQTAQAQSLSILLKRIKATSSDSVAIKDIGIALEESFKKWKPSTSK